MSMGERSPAAGGLTISAVAARTGVSAPVLRAWERRFGFPRPERLAGGHRRYPETDVEAIDRVVEARRAGRSLKSAIDLARPGASPAVDHSIYAGLRRAADLPAQVITRRTMLALSRAIEEEACACAERPHLVAAFQTQRALDVARPRWRDLLRTAESAIIFADLPRTARRGNTLQVAIPSDDPLRREWAVVCDAPTAAAVLAGWERPDGRFEAVWSVDAEAVRHASEVGRALAARLAPRLARPEDLPPLGPAADATATLRRATAVTTRAIARLDESAQRTSAL